MSGKIILYSGPVQSGKTTQLKNWTEQQKRCGGILMPVIDGKKHLYDIESGQIRKIELTEEKHSILKIGRYTFSENAFKWARKKIRDAVNKNKEVIIIDEIGPLELAGKGFEPDVSWLINIICRNSELKLIMVIRDRLLDNVIEHYGLDNKEYILTDSIKRLEE